MRINNNLMAMNTHRQLGINAGNGAKSIEKLSSGYRINRAGDDAAGLAISEKMRAQVRGLNQASRNSQDGISLIQTAEGALNETHDILQRMRELAVQSANDTNVNADRSAIQNEIDQLGQEIDRIASTTEFNTQSLLKGDGGTTLDKTGITANLKLSGGATTHVDAKTSFGLSGTNANQTIKVTMNGQEVTVNLINDSTKASGAAGTHIVDSANATGNTINVYFNSGLTSGNAETAVSNALDAAIAENSILADNYDAKVSGSMVWVKAVTGGDFEGSKGSIATVQSTTGAFISGGVEDVGTTTLTKAAKVIDLASYDTDAEIEALVGKGMDIGGNAIEFYNSANGPYAGDAIGVDLSAALSSGVSAANKDFAIAEAIAAHSSEMKGVTLSTSGDDLVVRASLGGADGNEIEVRDGATASAEFNATFQIGANQSQTIDVSINDMRSKALGIEGVNISTSTEAQKAITTINDALSKVSDERAKLGAFQNRLEHTIKNLDTSSENLQASESRIRDVDMAKEMMTFTKNNILQQAAQAMLAQANQAPQGVLQLLR